MNWVAFGTNAIVAYFFSESLSSAVVNFHVNARNLCDSISTIASSRTSARRPSVR
jgi:hypothetical protein